MMNFTVISEGVVNRTATTPPRLKSGTKPFVL